MLYGEVYADEIDTVRLFDETNVNHEFQCVDSVWDGHLEDGVSIPDYLRNSTHKCVPGYWLPPLLMVIFLLISNILLISMLIASFNNIFVEMDQRAQQIWLFQRYHQVMEYESSRLIYLFSNSFFIYLLNFQHRLFLLHLPSYITAIWC